MLYVFAVIKANVLIMEKVTIMLLFARVQYFQ